MLGATALHLSKDRPDQVTGIFTLGDPNPGDDVSLDTIDPDSTLRAELTGPNVVVDPCG